MLNKDIKISLVTICKNEAANLERTILSVLSQTFPLVEFLVIDGQSTDGTLAILKKYESRLAWTSEPDNGIYDAMNKGAKRASGDFVLFLNAGDYLLHPGVLAKAAALIEKSPAAADVYFGNIFLYNADTGSGWIWRPARRTRLTMFMSSLPHPATFFSRRAFEKNGWFDPSFRIAGDYEWFVRGMEKNHVTYQHIDTLVTLFNEGGVSTNELHKSRHQEEKQKIFATHYTKSGIRRLKIGAFFRKNFKIFFP